MNMEEQDNVRAFERREVAAAVDEATKANAQAKAAEPRAEVVGFQLSLEGRANLLTNLAGQALQGLLAGMLADPLTAYSDAVADKAMLLAKATMEAVEREVGKMVMSQGQDRG